jgi:hypothetical protein
VFQCREGLCIVVYREEPEHLSRRSEERHSTLLGQDKYTVAYVQGRDAVGGDKHNAAGVGQ